MIILILLCFLVTLTQFSETHGKTEARYECGPHGKFEYCIDGIPGCVIGCHCHPGYYFDTDSKICEPNIKLTQNYRRRYLSEPTRVYEYLHPILTPTATEPLPLLTTDRLDDKFDEISKDTDDLGDWLYNQFFKTIESQVINNTNTDKKDNGKKQLTRRSGGGDGDSEVFKKPNRKARKLMRSEKKRKHPKIHGLRRKLLRITEDDSLFQSESDSDYGSSDSEYSDSSGSSSGESSSDNTRESEKSDNNKQGDDKDHGHKKVIIFNRRPKPPLPSFIFLPGMDSPFYPPIGLPPPPPMPMYPMVPIPPMAPPFFPFPEPPCVDNTTTTTTTTTTTAIASDSTSTTESNTVTDTDTTTTELATRLRNKKTLSRTNESGKHQKLKNSQRNKLMQKLREQMKEAKKKEEALDGPHEEDAPGADEFPVSQEALTSHGRKQKKTKEKIPTLDDVDFKYLSELIHRVNQSQDINKQPAPAGPPIDLQNIEQPPLPSRRYYNSYAPPARVQPPPMPPRNLHNSMRSDDLYYTNLGRQIASMIRNAESKINQPVENYPGRLQYHSVVNQQSNMPRNYWERSVRSPLPQKGKSMDYLEYARPYLKQNTEKKLYNLENEVEMFAKTSKPLSLQDLENILNTMQRAHIHITFDDHEKSAKEITKQPSNASFNVNLLANYDKIEPYRRLLNPPDIEYAAIPKYYVELPKINETNAKQNEIIVPQPQFKAQAKNDDPLFSEIIVQQPHLKAQVKNNDFLFNDYWMYESPKRQITTPAPVVNTIQVITTNTSLLQDQQRYTKTRTKPTILPKHKDKSDTRPVHNPVVPQVIIEQQQTKTPQAGYLQFLRNLQPVIKQTSQKRPKQNIVSRPNTDNVVNYKRLKYFTGNKNKYVFEAASYPIQLASFRRTDRKPLSKMSPSYFHHELHHFDYFD